MRLKPPLRLAAGVSAAERQLLRRQLMRLVWPTLVENILQTTLGVANLMMVGRLGADPLAGVALANQVLMLLIVFFSGLAVGTTALVAHATGARDRTRADKTLAQSFLLGLIVAMAISLLGIVLAEPILRFLGASPAVARAGGLYLQINAAATPFLMVMLVGNGALRGAGDTRTPMTITAAINALNLALSYVLIFGAFGLPGQGVLGAAWALTAARLLGATLVLGILASQAAMVRLRWQWLWPPDGPALAQILTVGGPAALESAFIQIGMLAFSAIGLALGTAAYAAQSILLNISSLSFLPGFAFSVAATTMVGQSLGARRPDQATASAWEALRAGLLWMGGMGLLFLLAPTVFLRLYTSDPTIIAAGTPAMRLLGLGQPLVGTASILAGALRGAGDTRTPMVLGALCIWAIRVPVAYLCGLYLGWGLVGLWIGWLADFLVRGSLFFSRFQAGDWRKIRL